jgi:hypothetical protein
VAASPSSLLRYQNGKNDIDLTPPPEGFVREEWRQEDEGDLNGDLERYGAGRRGGGGGRRLVDEMEEGEDMMAIPDLEAKSVEFQVRVTGKALRKHHTFRAAKFVVAVQAAGEDGEFLHVAFSDVSKK